MNDILVNSFKSIFELTATQRSLVQMAFFGAFFIVSRPKIGLHKKV
jgi:fucose permease